MEHASQGPAPNSSPSRLHAEAPSPCAPAPSPSAGARQAGHDDGSSGPGPALGPRSPVSPIQGTKAKCVHRCTALAGEAKRRPSVVSRPQGEKHGQWQSLPFLCPTVRQALCTFVAKPHAMRHQWHRTVWPKRKLRCSGQAAWPGPQSQERAKLGLKPGGPCLCCLLLSAAPTGNRLLCPATHRDHEGGRIGIRVTSDGWGN